jgi:hypothetical protein
VARFNARHVPVMDERCGLAQAEASLETFLIEETEFDTSCVLGEQGEIRTRAIERGPKRMRLPRPDR